MNSDNPKTPTLFRPGPLWRVLAALVVLGLLFSARPAAAADAPLIGLIIKTESNPYFAKMREIAKSEAGRLGLELRSFSGKYDGDNDSQIAAIENLVTAGAKAILIAPSDPATLLDAVQQARAAGILVIALDTPFVPADAADGTFATDNFAAGALIGRWARARLGTRAAETRIATLDLSEAQVTVDVLRNQGFLQGFGIDVKDIQRMYDETDPRLVGHEASRGSEEGGQAAMERLLEREPEIDLVYTINEPAAAGAYRALKARGREKQVLLVSIDGGCPGVRNVAGGVIGATSMQFPRKMVVLGLEAVVKFLRNGERPGNSPGLDFFHTGTTLVTDQPMPDIPSIGSDAGLNQCWG